MIAVSCALTDQKQSGLTYISTEEIQEEDKDEDWETDCEDDDDNCSVIDATGDVMKIVRSSKKQTSAIANTSSSASIIQVANELIDLHKSLDSNQDKENLICSVRKLMADIDSKRIEKALPPRRKISVRGRPKNVKRKKIHYEFALQKEKEDAKKVAQEEKKTNVAVKKNVELIQNEKSRGIAYKTTFFTYC